jgi:CelD/BcsL family acetyltransferase involved in cellulose biosynthesis
MTRHRLPYDEPTPLEQTYVGQTARVDVPLKSVLALRKVAEELRGLATRLEYLTHMTDEKPSAILLEARALVRSCSHRMSVIRGRGRPRKSRWLDPVKQTGAKQKSRKPTSSPNI